MGQPSSYAVEKFDDSRRAAREVAEFRDYEVAVRAARRSLTDPAVSCVVVRSGVGELLYALDRSGEWSNDGSLWEGVGPME